MTFQIQIHTVKCQSREKIQTNQSTNVGMSESIFIPLLTSIPIKTSPNKSFPGKIYDCNLKGNYGELQNTFNILCILCNDFKIFSPRFFSIH